MINYINYILLSNEILLNLSNSTLEIVQNSKIKHSSINPYIENLQSAINIYSDEYKIEEKRIRKEKIRAKYKVPSKNIISSKDPVHSHYNKSEWSDAVKKLTDVFQRHDWDSFKPGSEMESKAIMTMLAELSNKCTNELSILNSIKDMDDKTLLNQCQKKEITTTSSFVKSTTESTFKTVRSKLEKSVNDLHNMISALQTSNAALQIDECETAINNLIADSIAKMEAPNEEERNIL